MIYRISLDGEVNRTFSAIAGDSTSHRDAIFSAGTLHARNPLPADVGREYGAEAIPPVSHRLMADIDATLEQQILDIAQRKWVPHVHHRHSWNTSGEELNRRNGLGGRARDLRGINRR
jgi:hypothetical protein